MTISRSAWEEAQHNLAQEFIDLFLPPRYTFSVETNYPETASMKAVINERANTLDLPEPKILRFEKLMEESCLEDFSCKGADWAVVFAYEVLAGFGHRLPSNLQGTALEGLKQLANAWGTYLTKEFERLFCKWQFFTALADSTFDLFISALWQIPAEELGGVIRESITPAYLRAGETIAYEAALFDNNQARMRESSRILQASDAELEREIASMFSGYSTEQLGREMQRMLVEAVSQLRELFSSSEFDEKLPTVALIMCRQISWHIGRRLNRNLQQHPQETSRLLEAMGHHNEIMAAMEQYRYRYGWQGDRNKAIELGWQTVARKYFLLSGKVERIKEDPDQERLIGLAEGLNDYTGKNSAIVAIQDGLLGKLGAYLKKAAENQEKDYHKKQMTDGNIALTEAKHAEDIRPQDQEGEKDMMLSDKEILSEEKEKYWPSVDPVADQLESREKYDTWYHSLTKQEKTVAGLKGHGYGQEEIAGQMGISQQRVSQLLEQAWRKFKKINQ